VFRVPQVDFFDWLSRSVTAEDYVVLKMDVEGAEHMLLPIMIERNLTRLVDVLLWECHAGAVLHGQGSSCWRLRDRLRDEARIVAHHEPAKCRSRRSSAASSSSGNASPASRLSSDEPVTNWDCYRFPDAHSSSGSAQNPNVIPSPPPSAA
jgi:hypothetical protein